MYFTLCFVLVSLGTYAETVPVDSATIGNILGEDFDNGTTTKIQSAEIRDEQREDVPIFNLKGQCVGKGSLKDLPKGIYICDRKKYIVK